MRNLDLPPALESTDMQWLGTRHVGKVRDSYVRGEERVLIATDRLSAFDKIITSVPLKGQVLTQMADFWFKRVASIVSHHVVAVPDPCVVIAREVRIIPIEVVVRGFLAGSAWRDYNAGRPISGVTLPPGMREFERLLEPVVTPSTKEAIGSHDMPISEAEIVKRGIVSASIWEEVRTKALQLFRLASLELSERGLIFVDTKYEFGLLDGRVVLADEIHTLDSSRFWMEGSYEAKLSAQEPPEMLDKEPIRRWLMERGFQGDGAIPTLSDEYRHELMRHYIRSYELITGTIFHGDMSAPTPRIERNLSSYFGL
ncbi:MAG: phosphoribosylaminoimidazolesuccinocarboxamide synthase [bacterium]